MAGTKLQGKRRWITKDYLDDVLRQIEFNQNFILQRNINRYQILLSILLVLFAFYFGLAISGNKQAIFIAVVIGVIAIIVYIRLEMEFSNRQANISTTYGSVSDMKEKMGIYYKYHKPRK